MGDDLQLPAKIVKEGEIVRDWREGFTLTLTAKIPDGMLEKLAKMKAEFDDAKRNGRFTHRMSPWDSRDADIIIE